MANERLLLPEQPFLCRQSDSFRDSISGFRVTLKVRRNTEVSRAPIAELLQNLNEFLAGRTERVRDLGRRRTRAFPKDDAVAFELTKLRGEHLFADTRKKSAKLGEARRAEAQVPKGQNFPFTANSIDGSLDRAAVMVFQEDSPLQKSAYFRASTKWLYHSDATRLVPLQRNRKCVGRSP